MPVIVCEHCGKDFEVYPYRVKEGAKYCSPDCAYAAKAPEPKTCEWCGDEYTGQNKQFCSKTCLGESLKKRVGRTCETCGGTFEVTPSATKHGRAKFCSRDCWAVSRKGVSYMPLKRVYLNCEMCDKRFWKWPSAVERGEGRFCSHDCSNEWKRTVTGKDHPLKKEYVELTCDHCERQYKIKPSLAERGSRFCSKQCADEGLERPTGKDHPRYTPRIDLTCKWCGKTYKKTPSQAKRSKFCSKSCHGSWTAANINTMTGIERAVAGFLDKLGINYRMQEQVGPWVVDFYIECHKLVIEADGVYWHSLPQNKKRDRKKDYWLRKNGYRLVRLPGDKIRNNPRWCITKITQHLQGHLL